MGGALFAAVRCYVRGNLLLDELELIRADAAHGADVVLGKLGGIDLDLVAAHDAHELVGLLLVTHDNRPFTGDESV